MKRIEIISGSLAVLGILFYVLNYSFGAMITIISLLTLSGLYFYFGFALFNDIQFREILKKDSYKDISTMRIFGGIGTGIAFSIILIGILFKILRWPFANQNLLIGGIMIFIILILSMIRFLKHKNGLYREIFLRFLIYGPLCCVLLFLPNYAFLELKYRNYPNYIEAVKNLDSDPDNTDLQIEEQKEYDKIKGR